MGQETGPESPKHTRKACWGGTAFCWPAAARPSCHDGFHQVLLERDRPVLALPAASANSDWGGTKESSAGTTGLQPRATGLDAHEQAATQGACSDSQVLLRTAPREQSTHELRCSTARPAGSSAPARRGPVSEAKPPQLRCSAARARGRPHSPAGGGFCLTSCSRRPRILNPHVQG